MLQRMRSPSSRRMRRGSVPCSVFAMLATLPVMAANDATDLSLEQLMQMTVVGASKYEQKQSEVAAAVSVITRQEIQAFGWRSLDEAVASLPGVYTTYDRQYVYLGSRGYGLPGDENTRVLVMINGNRMNDPTYDTGPFGLRFPVDMDLIERIEFIPGPGGAVYGQNAMFGVINVITRGGTDINGTELSGSYEQPQALGAGRATWGGKFDNGVSVVLSADGLNARGQNLYFDYGASGISGLAAGLDGEHERRAFLNVAGGPWSFDLIYANHTKYDPAGAFKSDPLVPGQYQGDGYTVAQLSYHDAFAADTLQLSGRLFSGQERYSSILSYGTPFSFPAIGDWVGAELRLLSTRIAAHKLMLGLEVQANTRQDQFILDLANPANNIYIPSSGYRAGLYAQDEWRIVEALTATLGARIDRNDVTGTKVSPRLALIWQNTAASTLKALFGRAFRAPNAFERDYTDHLAEVANPTLGGESIETFELVADYRASQQLSLRASLYRWTMSDLITLGTDPVSGLAQYQTGETDHAQGVELSADRTWEAGARLRSSVSVQKVTRSSGGDLPNSPEVLGKLNLSTPLHVGGLHLGYELKYDSRRLTLNGSTLGGYVLSDLNLSTAALARGLDVSLGFYNLFDKRYAEPAARINWQNVLEQDGRSVQLRLDYAF